MGIAGNKIEKYVITTCLVLSLLSCRSNLLLDKNQEVNIENIEKGKSIINNAAKTAGYQNFTTWNSYSSKITIKATSFFGKIGHPFKDNPVQLKLKASRGKVGGELLITNGKQKGEIWGHINNTTYKKKTLKENKKIKKFKKEKFQIATLQYLIEFPFRILEADKITFVKDSILNEKSYDIVFASWNTFKPQKDIDQYRLWINKKTKQVEIVDFTVRDKLQFVWSRMFFSDFKMFDGITIPTSMSSYTNLNLKKEALRITINSIQRN
ncbi:hypothetical protein D7030_02200 [Flavobacteriaceae bacterium AU392]|nr:hypothetical protein D1817_08675 [Flavobacteriaceae bacterium]RKM85508.1 hypothetical protein D7030_02200 [Flavobacteriaceae bacterium AU392]